MVKDQEIFDLIEREHQRQLKGMELIASENFVSDEVMNAMGSYLTNKYAEGLPGKRYYGGCQVVDIVEKKTVKTPDTLKGIVKCNNPKCITNNEPMQTLFHTVDKVLGIVRCHYCDKEQQLGKVELCK